jgi:hypothetical protein
MTLLEAGGDTPGCFLPLALLLFIPELLLSYLKVSPAGLEIRYWPFYKLHVRWEQVDRLDKYKLLGILPSDVLYLKQSAPFGSLSIIGRELQLGQPQRFVVLNDFRGWANGRLAENLRRYIPEIMELGSKK